MNGGAEQIATADSSMNHDAVNNHYSGEAPGGGDEDDHHSYETLQSRVAAGKLRSIEDLTHWLRSSLLLSSDDDGDDDENSGTSTAEIRVDESCWLHTGDPSRDFGPYELNLTLNATSVTLMGPDADAVAATLSSVLALGLAVVKPSPESNNGEGNNTTVTTTISIKAFATQPRRVLPRLTASSFWFLDQNNKDDEEPAAASTGAAAAGTSCTAAAATTTTSTAAPSSSSSSVSLLIHFCGIPAACPHWQRVCATVTSLELRQCQVLPVLHDETNNDSSSWNTLLGSSASPSPVQLTLPPRTLILSLTRPEFIAAFGTTTSTSGNDGVIIATNVHTLRMVLHFCLDDYGWTTFCQHHLSYSNVRTLEIRYLDLGDDEWQLLWNNMPLSIKTISLSFTDDFVDDHRRMTEDRRRHRTRAVLEAVRSRGYLRSVSFPVCQQDADGMTEIQVVLDSRR
jgi:hypothetical protein